MDRYFLFTLFLYLLSVLLALAENRTELKVAGRASRVSYWLGSALTLAILAARVMRGAPGGSGLDDFFGGTLITLTVLAGVCLVGRVFKGTSWAPAVLAAVSLVLGLLALMRVHTTGAAAQVATITSGHVICMFLALSAFTLSFIFSALFLVQDRLLKRRSTGSLIAALPPLELTSRLNFASITVGTAALAMGVLGGALALRHTADPRQILTDPAIALSGFMLFLYMGLVAIRRGALERARTVSVVSIVFYWLMLFVFWGAHVKV
jgi:HemX protein